MVSYWREFAVRAIKWRDSNQGHSSERNADWLDTAATAAGGYLASLSNDNLVKKVLAIEALDEGFRRS
jgi:hypothetical protein